MASTFIEYVASVFHAFAKNIVGELCYLFSLGANMFSQSRLLCLFLLFLAARHAPHGTSLSGAVSQSFVVKFNIGR